ncbi:hypothetical protein MTR67_004077 [Solanum verrucosum]|uniref:Uncharacterized protein n=1 Tax=Solanum verrucosum TaxID=315347 RepID=A0AAF0PTP9_SOLVR|nr:hypothetical protein MTR67_004077 [Solanum verrucosum]
MVKIVLRVDLEKIFMNEFSIKKKPDDIFSLIEFAISVAEVKYPTALDKHKDRMLNRLMNSGRYKEEEEKSGMLKEDIHEKLGTKERNKKTDFESSKRKFEQRSAEQKEAKRRIVMLE